jgi:hypothetical protein
MNINNLPKSKFFLTAAGISLFVLVLVLLLSPQKNIGKSTNPSSMPSALSAIVPLNLSEEKKNAAALYTDSISEKLPLALDSFSTSVGITTSIGISHPLDDPKEVIRLNINGLSYINKNELDESKNPNIVAFKESFAKAIEMLESQNIDPKRLIFVYSDVPYVRETASYWVDKLGLLR